MKKRSYKPIPFILIGIASLIAIMINNMNQKEVYIIKEPNSDKVLSIGLEKNSFYDALVNNFSDIEFLLLLIFTLLGIMFYIKKTILNNTIYYVV